MEENRKYKIEHGSEIDWVELHTIYQKAGSGCSLLCDVDVVIEMEDKVVFMEYKNYDVSQSPNPSKPPSVSSDKGGREREVLSVKIAKKYFGSYVAIKSMQGLYDKKYKYYFVIECSSLDSALRIELYERIRAKLPFNIQNDLPRIKKPLIDEFKLLDIKKWNELFPDFKLQKV
jgi:hypothetical protein